MPILDFENYLSLKQHQKAILCLDLGQKRIGLALSDAGWKLSSPYGKMENKKFTHTANEIFKIYDENECGSIIIGLPMNIDETEGAKCQSARQFGRNLLKIRDDLNIYFQDERFTTIEAQAVLAEFGLGTKKKSEKIDKIAASFILQDFLDGI
jgi:putative Holliday junction resolvase